MLSPRIARPRARVAALLAAASLTLSSCALQQVGTPAELPAGSALPGTRYTLTVADADEIRVLMRQRAKALLEGDRRGFLATVDDRDPAVVAEQETFFDNVGKLPVSGLSYYVSASGRTPEAVPGGDPVVRPFIVEHLTLQASLRDRISSDTVITFVRRDGEWLLGRESLDDTVAVRPWFGGPISVDQSNGFLVITDEAARPTAEAVGGDVADDLALVAAILDREPDDALVLDATSNGAAGEISEASGVEAAATTFSLLAGTRDFSDVRGVAGTAIKINPGRVESLVNDRVLLRHELTHLVLREYSGRVPVWMSEGIAEYVATLPRTVAQDRQEGYAQSIDLTERRRELVDTGNWGYDPAGDYLIARASVEDLVERDGIARFLALLDDVAEAGEPDTEEATDRALRRVYGVGSAAVARAAFARLG